MLSSGSERCVVVCSGSPKVLLFIGRSLEMVPVILVDLGYLVPAALFGQKCATQDSHETRNYVVGVLRARA